MKIKKIKTINIQHENSVLRYMDILAVNEKENILNLF